MPAFSSVPGNDSCETTHEDAMKTAQSPDADTLTQLSVSIEWSVRNVDFPTLLVPSYYTYLL